MIGISTSAGPKHYWHLWLKDKGYKIVELDLRHTYFPFYEFVIDKVAEDMGQYDSSIHSSSEALFSEKEIIRKAYQQVLVAEIDIAKRIGAKEIVFHLPTFFGLEALKNQGDTLKFLSETSKEARENGIQLLAEYPTRGEFTQPEILEKFFSLFPNIKLCLDVGHLKKVHPKLEKEKEIVEKLKDQIVHLHINDSGDDKKTENRDFGKEIDHYRNLLTHIKQICPIKKAIIEINDEDSAQKIHNTIKDIFE